MMKAKELVYYNNDDLTLQDKNIEPIRGQHYKGRMSTASRIGKKFDLTKSKRKLNGTKEIYRSKYYPCRRDKYGEQIINELFSKEFAKEHLPKEIHLERRSNTNYENENENELPFIGRGDVSFYSRKCKKNRKIRNTLSRDDKML